MLHTKDDHHDGEKAAPDRREPGNHALHSDTLYSGTKRIPCIGAGRSANLIRPLTALAKNNYNKGFSLTLQGPLDGCSLQRRPCSSYPQESCGRDEPNQNGCI